MTNTIIDEIVNQFTKHLKEDYFYIVEDKRSLLLIENKGEKYEVKMSLDSSNNKFLVIHRLEDLKSRDARYLKQSPKDCDYILLDLINKKIYIIELKNTPTTASEFQKQIDAGLNWLRHLLFCCNISLDDEWEELRVAIKYSSSRVSKTRKVKEAVHGDRILGPANRMKDVNGKPLILLQGKEFHLSMI